MNTFTTKAILTRASVLKAALQLFDERGFHGTTMRAIAERAGVSLGLTYRYFATKEALALRLYERLADDLIEGVAELEVTRVSERFRAAMHRKLDLLDAHREPLLALFAGAMDPASPIGVLAAGTSHVRSRVAGAFATVVLGAEAAPTGVEAAKLARMLYGIHLALVLVWTQDQSPGREASREAVDLAADALQAAGPLLAMLPAAQAAVGRVDGVLHHLLQGARLAAPSEVAQIVAQRLLADRRLIAPATVPSEAALALHLPTIQRAVDTGEPLQLVLPAFPAKAPNPSKVLGKLPDMAEALALQHLADLTARLAEAHPPGAQLTVCSDGHVFADVVGVPDADVTAYREALKRQLPAGMVLFDLMDVYGKLSPDQARERLLDEWAESPEALHAEAARSPAVARLVDGQHRFLFEDLVARDPTLSRSQARKRTRKPAYEMVRRSRAWGRVVDACFPGALRLSIHPQSEVSSKIGVNLLPVDDVWLTPWHGVALLEDDRVRLVKRADAEALGAVVVEQDGRPSHMELR